jgi:hypothetical protein
MNLPIEAVNEFLEIYQRKIGMTITFDEAGIKAENFLRLMMLITSEPFTKNNGLVSNKHEKE